MNLKEKIIEKFYEEPKIFRKINANSAAKLKLFVIEDVIEIASDSYELDAIIKTKVADFEEFLQKLKEEKNLLKNKIIEEYSVLKFYASESTETLLDYAYKITSSASDKELEIANALTGENIKLTSKTKKMYLKLINNLINTKYPKGSKKYMQKIKYLQN